MHDNSILQSALRHAAVAGAIALGCVFLTYKSHQNGTAKPVTVQKPITAPAGDNLASASLPIGQPETKKVERRELMPTSKSAGVVLYNGSGTFVGDGANGSPAGISSVSESGMVAPSLPTKSAEPSGQTAQPSPQMPSDSSAKRNVIMGGSKSSIVFDKEPYVPSANNPPPQAQPSVAPIPVQTNQPDASPPAQTSSKGNAAPQKRKVIFSGSKSASPVFNAERQENSEQPTYPQGNAQTK